MNSKTNKITVIIPTKNRPDDLEKAIQSILTQDRIPEQLIIVDQSADELSKSITKGLTANHSFELTYIHDTSISGLVEAKRVGVENAHHEIICFLEDDIELDESYLTEIMKGFENDNEMVACSGIITNQPSSSPVYIFFHELFSEGYIMTHASR